MFFCFVCQIRLHVVATFPTSPLISHDLFLFKNSHFCLLKLQNKQDQVTLQTSSLWRWQTVRAVWKRVCVCASVLFWLKPNACSSDCVSECEHNINKRDFYSSTCHPLSKFYFSKKPKKEAANCDSEECTNIPGYRNEGRRLWNEDVSGGLVADCRSVCRSVFSV